MSILITSIQHHTGILSAIKKKKIKLSRLDTEKVITICRLYDCLCRKSQGICKKFLELINKLSKVTGYKVNTQK